ncbi:MAG: hypothetical protein ACI4LO_01915 [Anaerovoracaceae bacterium]
MNIADMADIKLDENWQITASATGDFLKASGKYECLMQEIELEALTQEGDLFYDENFGWSLMDFIHAEKDEIVELEIVQRIKDKLSFYEQIDTGSISVSMGFQEDIWNIAISFRFKDDTEERLLELSLDRINAEVVIND